MASPAIDRRNRKRAVSKSNWPPRTTRDRRLQFPAVGTSYESHRCSVTGCRNIWTVRSGVSTRGESRDYRIVDALSLAIRKRFEQHAANVRPSSRASLFPRSVAPFTPRGKRERRLKRSGRTRQRRLSTTYTGDRWFILEIEEKRAFQGLLRTRCTAIGSLIGRRNVATTITDRPSTPALLSSVSPLRLASSIIHRN